MELLILLCLVLLNGVFAMSEMALVSSRSARLEQRAKAGSRGARVALQLSGDPATFLSTVQVGITTIGILSGAFGENAIAERLVETFDRMPALAPYSDALATTVMVLVVTYFSVVLGEIVPKRLALLNAERVASVVAPAMSVLSRVAYPLVALFSLSSDGLLRLLGLRGTRAPEVSAEEIRMMLAQGADAGVFHAAEQTMVGNVLGLDDLKVTAIMTPRRDIVWVDTDGDAADNHALLRESGHQIVPVCRGGLDEVVGLLDTKRYLAACLDGPPPAPESLVRPPVAVPESISPLALLEKLKQKRSHLALVIDEYGSVEGLVSLTDVLQAIVGHVPVHSHDQKDAIVRRDDGSWLLDGLLPMSQVSDVLGLEGEQSRSNRDYQTLAGFMLFHLKRVPAVGDRFTYGALVFEVVDMDGHRVDRVMVSRA